LGHDALDARVLVSPNKEEPVPVRTDLLVLFERCADALGARLIRTFADKHGLVSLEAFGALRDSLVYVSEQRLGVRDSHFSFAHASSPEYRLP
jgi:hypothetical protein